MNSGTWTLVLARVEPGNTATIEIIDDGTGATEPAYFLGEQTIGFLWSDGRRSIWSWANLLSADFAPVSTTTAEPSPSPESPYGHDPFARGDLKPPRPVSTDREEDEQDLGDRQEPVVVEADRMRRLRSCVEQWPECSEGEYNPNCCRFPKSCSCTVYDPERVSDADLEPASTSSADALPQTPPPEHEQVVEAGKQGAETGDGQKSVVVEVHPPSDEILGIVAGRIIAEHGETIRKLGDE